MSMFEQALQSRPGQAEVWTVSQGDDSGLVVEFFDDAVEDEAATMLAGRPIYKPVEMIRIYIPGDKTTTVVKKNDDIQKQRFAQQYAQYKARGESTVIDGTPVSEWPLLNESQRRELRAAGFQTVENIAEVNDQTISMNGHLGDILHKLRGHAQAYLAKAKDGEAERRLQAELQERDKEIEALKAQVSQIAAIKADEVKTAQPVQAVMEAPSVQPQGMEQAPIAGLSAVHSSLDDIPEVEPVEQPKRRGRPRKNPEE